MSTPKRQHTTPRVYLENFCEDDGRLTLYSKRQAETRRPKPVDALVRSFYYSQPLNGELNAEHGIETEFLHGLETRYNELYTQLIEGLEVDLVLLFQTLASMRARSAAFREAFEIGLAELVDEQVRAIPRSAFPSPPESIPDIWDKVHATIDPHRSLIAMAHYTRFYMRGITECSYSVVRAPKGTEFLTSDNPVIWFERGYQQGREKIYLTQPTSATRVVFPINKCVALLGRVRRPKEAEFRTGVREIPRRLLRSANEMQLACAWDGVVGTARLPVRSRSHYSKLAPTVKIDHFDPKQNTFLLNSWSLEPLRKKRKFRGASKR